jgi:hypothetical protein
MTRFNTLLLDQSAWDLVIDSAGNIAMAQPAYALAQDVASAVRTFLGEVWYDQTQGIPYFDNVLGKMPSLSLLKGYIEKAAMTVPGVVSAKCVINSFANRQISGQIIFVDEQGEENGVNI